MNILTLEIYTLVNTFKYLGSTLAENGDMDAEMTHRIESEGKTKAEVVR